jgi:hypothetical protein
MAMALSLHEPLQDMVRAPLHTTQPIGVHHQADHTRASFSPAAEPDCHGSRTAQSQPTTDVVTLSPEGSDTTHCTEHADCHHCCPLAWVNWADIGKPEAPTLHPAGRVHNWHSASWMPGLRPPKA